MGIASWNDRDRLAGCLERIRSIGGPNIGLFVVDNGSADGTATMVKEKFPEAHLKINEENRGAAGGRNDVFEMILGTHYEFILILDPDVHLHDDALNALLQEMDDHPEMAVLGMKGYYADRPNVFWCRGGGLYNPWKGYFERSGIGEEDHGQYDRVEEVDSIPACLTFLRREALERCPRMDERYFIYFEESDWNFQMKRAGFRLATSARAKAVHQISSSLGVESPTVYYYRTRNNLLFAWRNTRRAILPAFGAYYIFYRFPHLLLTLYLSRQYACARAVLEGLRDAIRGRWYKRESHARSATKQDGTAQSPREIYATAPISRRPAFRSGGEGLDGTSRRHMPTSNPPGGELR